MIRRAIAIALAVTALTCISHAEERFPPPDFTDHKLPVTVQPAPRGGAWVYIDLAALVGALTLASILIHKKRSRRGMLYLTLISLAYFGFYRKGCICPVGSIQNIVLAIADSKYALPLTAGAFFFIPLAFALFFGRAFCSSVCPLGAIQDVCLVRPVKLPTWLSKGLSLLPVLYLGAAVLYAATGTKFLICRFDPFVGFFRMGASTGMIVFGALVLATCVFVGRSYCRFLCPYGVLLSWVSRFSFLRVRITPDICLDDRLCEAACPFEAVRAPEPESEREPRETGRRRLGRVIVAVPVAMALGGVLGYLSSGTLSRIDKDVAIAERLLAEERGLVSGKTLETKAIRSQGRDRREVLLVGKRKRSKFTTGGTLLGVFAGLMICLKLAGLSVKRRLTGHEPDRGECFACARCYLACPRERLRLGLPVESADNTIASEQQAGSMNGSENE